MIQVSKKCLHLNPMRKIGLFLVIIFSVQLCYSQMVAVAERNSGYLGKRLALGASFIFSPSFEPQKPEGMNSFITFNKDFTLSAEILFRDNFSLTAIAGYGTTSAHLDETAELLDANNQFVYAEPTGNGPKVTDFRYGGWLNFYRKKKAAIAPMGVYYRFGVIAHNYTLDFSEIEFVEYTYDEREPTRIYKLKNYITRSVIPELAVGVGAQTNLSEYLFINYGLDLGLLFIGFMDDGTTLNNEYEVYYRLSSKQFVNYHIGLSYVL